MIDALAVTLFAVRAVIVVTPLAMPVTRPVDDTLATLVLALDHVTGELEVISTPAASRTSGVNACVAPTPSDADSGVMVSVAGTPCTLNVAVPRIPLLVCAVMVAVPGATAVTTPACDTVATVAAEVVHVSAGVGVMMTAAASRTVGVSVCVAPTFSVVASGASVTLVGTAATTTVAVPTIPFDVVAVIVALPDATAVTTPDCVTVATILEDELHCSVGVGVIATPAASLTVGANVCVAPTSRLADVGVNRTLAGTANTPIVAVPVTPFAVRAVMIVDPAAIAVTVPVADTVATMGCVLANVSAGVGVMAIPAASFTIIVSNCVAPTAMVVVAGATSTDAGMGAVTFIVMLFCTNAAPVPVVAVTVAVPTETPVITPVALTLATVGADVVHTSVRPAIDTLAASRGSADSDAVDPTTNESEVGAVAPL